MGDTGQKKRPYGAPDVKNSGRTAEGMYLRCVHGGMHSLVLSLANVA